MRCHPERSSPWRTKSRDLRLLFVLYQGMSLLMPHPPTQFLRNKVRGEAALKPPPRACHPERSVFQRSRRTCFCLLSCIRAWLQPHEPPPTRFSRNKGRGEAAIETTSQNPIDHPARLPACAQEPLPTSRLRRADRKDAVLIGSHETSCGAFLLG